MFDVINKLFYSIFFSIILICYSQIFHIPFMRKKSFVNRNSLDFLPIVYESGFKSKLFYTGDFISSGKIDIYIGNHFNYLDFLPHISLIKNFYDGDIFIIYSNYIDNIPLIGRWFKYSNNISVKKKILDDKQPLLNFIKTVKKGIIFMYPEGTRINSKKLNKAKEYSRDNLNTEFNNLLVPKFKGLHLIINELNKNNKLGNIIDGTIKVKNVGIDNQKIKHMLTKDIGNTYCQILTYKPEVFEDYDKFKLWFLQIWKIKDDYLNNYLDYYYQKTKFKMKTSVFILDVMVVFIMINTFKYLYFKKIKHRVI